MFPLRPRTFEDELDKGKCFVHGFDHFGQPVVYYFADSSKDSLGPLNDQIMVCLFRIEQAIARLPMRDGKISVCVCFPENKDQNYHRNNDLVAAMSRIIPENYPERLHALLLYPRISASVLDIIKEGLSIPSEVVRRIIAVPNKEALLGYIPSACLLERLGGSDTYSFQQDKNVTGSSILMPPLWVGLPRLSEINSTTKKIQCQDYYPPPLKNLSQIVEPVSISGGVSEAFVCLYCSKRVDGDTGLSVTEGKEMQCALCRYASGADDYFGGWKPIDLTMYPEPSEENFRQLEKHFGQME